jgi:hypothetical protein
LKNNSLFLAWYGHSSLLLTSTNSMVCLLPHPSLFILILTKSLPSRSSASTTGFRLVEATKLFNIRNPKQRIAEGVARKEFSQRAAHTWDGGGSTDIVDPETVGK